MRVRNYSDTRISISFDLGSWVHRDTEKTDVDGSLRISARLDIEPYEVSEDLDLEPDHPFMKNLLTAHPDLRPYECPTFWDLLDREF